MANDEFLKKQYRMKSLSPCNMCAPTNFSAIELSIPNGFSNGFKSWKLPHNANVDLKLLSCLTGARYCEWSRITNKNWNDVVSLSWLDVTCNINWTWRLFQITFSALWILVTDDKKVKRVLDLQYQRWNLKCRKWCLSTNQSQTISRKGH